MSSESPFQTATRDAVIVLAFSVILILPIGFLGIPDNYDVMEHMRFAVSYSDALRAGHLLPVWSDLDNHGFGGAGVRLYPPLTYILMALIKSVGLSWHWTVTLTLMLGMFIGCLGVYRFVKEFYPNGYPLLAAFIYGVIPYHLFQIYQLFLFAEFMAAAFTPYVFLYGLRTFRNGRLVDAMLLALFFSLLVLTHIPSTIILSIALTIFLATQFTKQIDLKSLGLIAFSGALTLALTSFYWLKVVTEVSWIKHDSKEFYDSGLYTYSVYLFPISLSPPSFYQIKALWLFDIIIALTLLLFFFLAMLAFIKRKQLDRLSISLFVTTAIAIFLTTLPSKPVWDGITFLQKLQFPWRWLSISAFIISILVAVIIAAYRSNGEKPGRTLIYSSLTLSTVIGLFVISQIVIPSAPTPSERFNQDVADLTNTLGCNCWWPVDASAAAFDNKERLTVSGRNADIQKWAEPVRQFTVSAGEAGDVRVATFYYPYWKAVVDEREVEIKKAEDGSMLIPLSAEKAEVSITFTEPTFLHAARYVSIIAWLALIIALFISSRNYLRRSPSI